MLYVTVWERGETRVLSFARDEVVVGSGDGADLVVNQPGVPEAQLRARVSGGSVSVEDLRSGAVRAVTSHDRVDVAADIGLWFSIQELSLVTDDADPVERDLLGRIAEDPRDPTVRMVYADWLEANGREIAAEFVRVQLGLAGVRDATDPAFTAASARLAELAVALPAAWRARVAMAFVENCEADGVGFELVCPQRWDRLAPTARDDVRRCTACRRDVHYCTNMIQARSVATAGGCVAIDVRTAPGRKPHDLGGRGTAVVGRVVLPMVRYGRR